MEEEREEEGGGEGEGNGGGEGGGGGGEEERRRRRRGEEEEEEERKRKEEEKRKRISSNNLLLVSYWHVLSHANMRIMLSLSWLQFYIRAYSCSPHAGTTHKLHYWRSPPSQAPAHSQWRFCMK